MCQTCVQLSSLHPVHIKSLVTNNTKSLVQKSLTALFLQDIFVESLPEQEDSQGLYHSGMVQVAGTSAFNWSESFREYLKSSTSKLIFFIIIIISWQGLGWRGICSSKADEAQEAAELRCVAHMTEHISGNDSPDGRICKESLRNG